MAKLWITVFEAASETALDAPIQDITPVDISGTSAQSEAVTGSTESPAGKKRRTLRLFADTDCHVAWGDDPTAGTDNFPLGAENPEYINVVAGGKVAVLERV